MIENNPRRPGKWMRLLQRLDGMELLRVWCFDCSKADGFGAAFTDMPPGTEVDITEPPACPKCVGHRVSVMVRRKER